MRISVQRLSVAMLNANIGTSKQLAKTAGVSVNTISRLRNGGSITLLTLKRLANALNVEPSEIIEEEVKR